MFHGLSWDSAAYFVDRLPDPQIAGYTRVDTQLRWRIAESLKVSVVGQNLLRDDHVEFNDPLQSVNSSQVARSIYGKFTWRF